MVDEFTKEIDYKDLKVGMHIKVVRLAFKKEHIGVVEILGSISERVILCLDFSRGEVVCIKELGQDKYFIKEVNTKKVRRHINQRKIYW
jgi:hypothetical protein